MKIKLATRIATPEYRRALWWHYYGNHNYVGNPQDCPMADRMTCRVFMEENGVSSDDDIHYDWQNAIKRFKFKNRL